MCLYNIDDEETIEYQTKTEPIIAYKIFRKEQHDNGCITYSSPFKKNYYTFHIGTNNDISQIFINCFSPPKREYQSGFHSYLHLDSAIMTLEIARSHKSIRSCNEYVILEVIINPEDVIAVGSQQSDNVIVSKSIVINSFEDQKIPVDYYEKYTEKCDQKQNLIHA